MVMRSSCVALGDGSSVAVGMVFVAVGLGWVTVGEGRGVAVEGAVVAVGVTAVGSLGGSEGVTLGFEGLQPCVIAHKNRMIAICRLFILSPS